MDELMIFEGNNVEVFNWEDKVLFNPRDVGKCLELTDSAIRMAISKMNKNQVIKLTNSDVKDIDFRKLNNRGENFLTESGVYKLAFKSNKKEAEHFTDWIADEVLPSIRKTGNYIANNTPMISNKEIQEFKEDVRYIRSQVCIKKKDSMLYTNMIKEYLGIKTIKEDKYGYNFIKKLFLLKVGVDKFEDVEVNADNLIMLNECCQSYKLPYQQISLF